MNRSAGVTVSAVLAILGSVALVAFGGFAALMGILIRRHPDLVAQQQGIPMPFSITTVLLVEAAVFFGLGTFGIIAAIALLRLRNWARISFAIFAGILCFLCAVGVFGTLMLLIFMPQAIPPDPNVPPGMLSVIFAFYLVIEVLLGALAIWWLVYFTRRKVKEQFMSPAEAALPRRGPLSVTIIAWLLAVGGGLSVLYLPVSIPMVLFGIVLHGWTAKLVLFAFGGGSLLAGAGILRWRPSAHSLAVGIYFLGLLNALSYYFIPGAFARMREAYLEFMPQTELSQLYPIDMFNRFGMFIGVLGGAACLWFLLTRRKAFLEACTTPQETMTPRSS